MPPAPVKCELHVGDSVPNFNQLWVVIDRRKLVAEKIARSFPLRSKGCSAPAPRTSRGSSPNSG